MSRAVGIRPGKRARSARARRGLAASVAAVVLALAGCASAPAAAPAPSLPEDAPTVAFYGDSYTLGTGATEESRRWSTRISADRGWREVNPSRNGLGFVNNRDRYGADLPGEIIAADPDIVIVTMGLNDNFSYDRAGERIRERMRDDFATLTAALPDARFVVVEPFWYTAERPPSVEVIIGWVRDAAAEIDADYIPGASRWIQGRDGEMAADGLHPNDHGYDLMTARMDEALAAIGL